MKYVFWFFWKIWFYVLVTIVILLLSPVLFVFTLREKWYPQFYWVARNLWAKPILYGMGFYPEVCKNQSIDKDGSYVLIANHTSVTDVMLMYVCSKNPFVFVGKKELARTPVFGYFYKRFAILVDRSNAESRKQVYASAKKRLNSGLSICIFPEGGVPDESVILDKFKDGAFSLAIDFQIPIVPMTFFDNKRLYPFRFFAGSPGKMRVKIHPFVQTNGLTFRDKNALKEDVRNTILQELEADAKSK